MELKVSRRELDIILCALNGTNFDNHEVEKEKKVLISRLIDERNRV